MLQLPLSDHSGHNWTPRQLCGILGSTLTSGPLSQPSFGGCEKAPPGRRITVEESTFCKSERRSPGKPPVEVFPLFGVKMLAAKRGARFPEHPFLSCALLDPSQCNCRQAGVPREDQIPLPVGPIRGTPRRCFLLVAPVPAIPVEESLNHGILSLLVRISNHRPQSSITPQALFARQ